eukprot:scaffold548961_cov15-Prasinocladus_malaysianus.AAC.1
MWKSRTTSYSKLVMMLVLRSVHYGKDDKIVDGSCPNHNSNEDNVYGAAKYYDIASKDNYYMSGNYVEDVMDSTNDENDAGNCNDDGSLYGILSLARARR